MNDGTDGDGAESPLLPPFAHAGIMMYPSQHYAAMLAGGLAFPTFPPTAANTVMQPHLIHFYSPSQHQHQQHLHHHAPTHTYHASEEHQLAVLDSSEQADTSDTHVHKAQSHQSHHSHNISTHQQHQQHQHRTHDRSGTYAQRHGQGQHYDMHGQGGDRGAATRPNVAVVRLLLPVKSIGAIIGKGGETVKQLREASKARVVISPAVIGISERIVTISGQFEATSKALDQIARLLEESTREAASASFDTRDTDPHAPTGEGSEKSPLTSQESELEHPRAPDAPGDAFSARPGVAVRVLAHHSQIGNVIGKGGATVQQMREQSGAQIFIQPDTLPHSTERTINVVGSAESASNCLQLIARKIMESPARGQVILYQPGASAVPPFSQGGVFVPPFQPMQTQLQYSRQQGQSTPSTTRSGGRSSYGSSHAEYSPQYAPQHFQYPPAFQSYEEQQSHASQTGSAPLSPGVVAATSSQLMIPTVQLPVPVDKLGAIIGKGGASIRDIRNRSGALVRIGERVHGSDSAMVFIGGSTEARVAAHMLIMQRIHQANGPYASVVVPLTVQIQSNSEDGVPAVDSVD